MIAVNSDHAYCPYEVGDILQTINSADPAQRWPGTQWKQITDRFIRGVDSKYPAGSTGGSWTHVQAIDEMPSHLHTWATQNQSGQTQSWDAWTWQASSTQSANPPKTSTAYTTSTGGGQPMDITNPYFAAYIWLRTA